MWVVSLIAPMLRSGELNQECVSIHSTGFLEFEIYEKILITCPSTGRTQ